MPVKTIVNLTPADDTYTAAAGDYEINGVGGNDTITTGAGNSSVNTGVGNSTITTGAGDSLVHTLDGNQTITTGAGDSSVSTGLGNSTITTGAGVNIVQTGNGNNTITTGAGASHITTGAGLGDDTITTGAGDAVVDSGLGNDTVTTGAGNDLVFYHVTGNQNNHSVFNGGTGIDTLNLVMTRAEWMSDAVQTDVASYLDFLAANKGANGEDGAAAYAFKAFGLTASMFEKLQVTVDGVVLQDATNRTVALHSDAISTTEKVASAALNVLANDTVPDLIKSFSFTNPTNGSVHLDAAYLDTASSPSAQFIYTPTKGFYDYLAVGESANDFFTYTVTDAAGGVSTATVEVTINGTNDVPVIGTAVLSGAVTEKVTATAPLTSAGTISFSDVDLSDVHTVSAVAASSGTLGKLTASITTDDSHTTGTGGVITWNYSVDNTQVQYLAAGETKVETFTVSLDDGHGGVVPSTVSVTITGVNEAPVLGSPAALHNVAANTPYVIQKATLLEGWTDVDKTDILSVTGLTVNHGTVTDNSNGTIVVTPAAGYSGTEVISYGVSDGHVTVPTMLAFTVDPAPPANGNVLVSEHPWGQNGDAQAMDHVFGSGGYTSMGNYSFNVNSVFNSTNNFVFLEGGAGTDRDLNNFVNANKSAVLDWVEHGGHLLIQSAGWYTSVDGPTGNTLALDPWGYSTANRSGHLTSDGVAALTTATIGGPTYSGFYLSHDVIQGAGLTSFMVGNENGGVILAGTSKGSGYIMYSGLTDIHFNTAGGVLESAIAFTSAHQNMYVA